MSSVKVKICGITRRGDAEACVAAGVDYLGFVFVPESPRRIPPREAGRIVALLPREVTPVGVFVHPAPGEVEAVAAESGIRIAQLSGDESPEECARIALPLIKVFRTAAPPSPGPAAFRLYAAMVDGSAPGAWGGTGRLADPSLARALALSGRLFLAGGLTPENVASAAASVRPYAVDVSSGVEERPGVKDHRKVRGFIAALRQSSSP